MKKGFTLVEALLYITMVLIIVGSSSVVFITILESRVKNQTIIEVEHQGAQVLEVISQVIRNAENINSPSMGISSSILSLDVTDSSKDPTIFDLSSGVVRIKEGANSEIALTNDRVIVSNLLFQNLSRTATPGNIRVSFTITHYNPGARNEYDFTKTFFTSASLR